MLNFEKLYKDQKYREIIENFDREIEISERNFAKILIVAKSHFNLKSYKIANELLLKLNKIIDSHEINYYLALSYYYQKQIPQALLHIDIAKKQNPILTKYYLVQGELLTLNKNYDQAINIYNEGLKLKLNDSSYSLLYLSLGKTNFLKGDYLQSEKNFKTSIEYNNNFESNRGLGFLYKRIDNLILSNDYFKKSLEFKKNSQEILNLIGVNYVKLNLNSKAEKFFLQILELNPNNNVAWSNLAKCQSVLRKTGEATNSYKKAIQLKSNDQIATSNYLYTLNYLDDTNDQKAYDEHLKFNSVFGENQITQIINHVSNSKIRIGYLSADFRKHAVMEFLLPVILNHDYENFEIFCFSNSSFVDEYTKLIKQKTQYVDISRLNDEQAISEIKSKKIDILIDLAGHTKGNRLSIFEKRAATIQISWIGYPCTTGIRNMDFRIVDEFTDPYNYSDEFYTEQRIRMKNFFMTYKTPEEYPIHEPPFLKNDYITFGSFNNVNKISNKIIELWSEILSFNSNNKLLLKYVYFNDEELVKLIKSEFNHHGIKSNQLIFYGYMKQEDHFNLYNQIDIALDPFPYNGTTTTCESLWMGVPVLTLKGNRHVSRVSYSILKNLGLHELVANDLENYVKKAINLSEDLERIKKYKNTIRDKLKASTICNHSNFLIELEQILKSLIKN